MTVVSRLQLDHPALGTAGGSGLHTSIEAIYTKLGNNIATRILTAVNLNNSATATVEHNFKAAFADLRMDLYLYDESTTALTRITELTTPALSDFTIAATSGFETTKIDITNNSGAQRDLALVVDLDPIGIDELTDVVITSPTEGDVLVYDDGDAAWKNQAQAANKAFNKFVGPGETYTTLAAALAAAAEGDSFLVTGDTDDTTDINWNVADCAITWNPGAVSELAGSLTNGFRITASRVTLVRPHFRFEPSGTQAKCLSIEVGDVIVDCARLETNTAQTFTSVVNINASGARAYVRASVIKTLGTLTDLLVNAGSLTSAEVWGG